jgi:hypothetical protein
MNKKLPPVPPDNQSPFADGQAEAQAPQQTGDHTKSEKRGRHANIKQNTTNQGYQQDR